jgi:ABC-type nitrate/sulfonate/bicarbonate transport system ATPase subunit
MNAVEASSLKKVYGKVVALAGVDLTVTPGTIFGLVGPNGAGKTTLIKSLVGSLRSTAGRSVSLFISTHLVDEALHPYLLSPQVEKLVARSSPVRPAAGTNLVLRCKLKHSEFGQNQ